jgi:hypothetical protein
MKFNFRIYSFPFNLKCFFKFFAQRSVVTDGTKNAKRTVTICFAYIFGHNENFVINIRICQEKIS